MAQYYRIVVESKGIYEAVQQQCPKGDSRRFNKPDGSWLIKAGEKYPGAISFWTEKGIKKYDDSGLLDWHISVVKGQVYALIIDRPNKVLYTDDYQIICQPREVTLKKKETIKEFIKEIHTSTF